MKRVMNLPVIPGVAFNALAPTVGSVFMRLPMLIAVCGIVFASAHAAEEVSAQKMVEAADEVRFPKGGFEVDIHVTSSSPGEDQEARTYHVLSQGNEKSIVQVTEPAAERGQSLLMRGRDLWMYLPDVSQPIRLSFSQRLTGQVANGDIARANFSGDYEAKWLRAETVDNQECNVLELTASDRSVTYSKVVLWVRKASNYPYKAEFYSLSDRLLKTAWYENYQQMQGRIRPTRIVLKDAVKKGEQSVLDYSNMQMRDLPDRIFTKSYLQRLN
ncbi:MAG: outer membrane lipoprotein-sorting protein [Burkholderiaceae bacterium]|nr:MAG: outer membrane lipoprotein-sorting protein [Burkholderiaceae bacterium]